MVVALVSRRPSRTRWQALLIAPLVLLAGAVLVLHEAPAVRAAQDPVSCASSVGLVNGGFEQPGIGGNSFRQLPQSQVTGWRTTASDGLIEVWRTPYLGVVAGVGQQFAELNATQFSTLYQDQPTIPGTVMRWSLLHRGRGGVDTMAVNIGAPDGAMVRQAQMSDGTSAWGAYSGFYTVPAGQTTTRFAFEAVSTAGGNISVGNFLDDIVFGTNACLVATSNVTSSSGAPYGQAGDVLTYTVDVSSGGGNPAIGPLLDNVLPPGVSFVPGSIRVTTDGVTTAVTDAVGEDRGEYDPTTRRVTVRLGDGAGGSTQGTLRTGTRTSVTYQVVVDPSPTPVVLTDDATITFLDPLTGNTRTSTTNPVGVLINPIADVAATVVRTGTDPVVAGLPVRYTAVLASNGQDPAYVARLTSVLPGSLTGVTATIPGGTCAVANGTLTCTHPYLAAGEKRTVTIDATVSPDALPGSALTFAVRASSAIRDLTPGNDDASVTDTVTTKADVGVALTAAPAQTPAGTEVTYTARVTNKGPSTARSITLDDAITQDGALPLTPSDVRASVPGGSCSTGTDGGGKLTLRCTVPDVRPGAEAAVTVVFRSSPDRAGTLLNTATVASTTPETAAADNTASVSVSLTTAADLGVTVTATPASQVAGRDVTYTAVVLNRGPSTARTITLEDTLVLDGAVPPTPSSLRASVPGGTCTTAAVTNGKLTLRCTLPDLRPGATATVTAVFSSAPDRPGTLTNTARVTSTTPETNAADNTVVTTSAVVTVADVGVTLVLSPAAVPRSGTTKFTVTVSNTGPSTAKGIRVTPTLPAGVTATLDAGGPCSLQNCTIASLASGATVTLTGTLTASVDVIGKRDVTVAAGGPATGPQDPQPANNTTTVVLTVGAPSLQVSVIGAMVDTRRSIDVQPRESGEPGDDVYWTYVVTNAGDVPIAGIDVVLPGGGPVAGVTTCRPGVLEPGKTTACRSSAPQKVLRADVTADLRLSTTVEVVASWDGGPLRTPSVTGSLKTVLPSMGLPAQGLLSGPAPADVELRPAASGTTLVASPGDPGAPGQLVLLAGALVLVGAATALAVRRLHRRP